ncbi:MarC family protein [Lentisphaerota bacterium ZTH]|nr:MarC family protein [Lentisphaerota bacterium]WET06809.1 MarC family protein [Lentisphaerota bacterium ZTH]
MSIILSTAIVLFLVMDPFGNLPMFIAVLKNTPADRRSLVVFREAIIALAILAVFLLFGRDILKLLQITQGSLDMAGGIILFVISLQMIFGFGSGAYVKTHEEPFIVPLAVPLIAGPSAVAVVILMRGYQKAGLGASFAALLLAWLLTTIILMASAKMERILGPKVIRAGESLMGLLLTAISVQMLVRGIKMSFNLN